MRKIKGEYCISCGFTTLFSNNTIYTIAKNGEWGCVSVGSQTTMGGILIQADYDRMKADCDKVGTFILK